MDWLTTETIKLLGEGVLLTVALTAVTSILSLLIGVTVGGLRLSGWRFARIYVDIFRNIPALVLIIFWAFAVPNVFPLAMRQQLFFNNPIAAWGQIVTGISLPYYLLAAIIGLTLNTSAYLAELFRAGVGTIPQEYVDAARSLGASPTAVFRIIIRPQGIRAAFPAIATRLIHNMKNTALASFVAVPELFQATQTAVTRTFRAVEFLSLTAVLYLLLSFTFAALLRWIDQRLQPNPLAIDNYP